VYDGIVELDPAAVATLSDEEMARTLGMEAAALLDAAETIVRNPGSTIEPPQERSAASGRLALEALGAQREERGVAAGLELDETIGEGGMGVVRLATQRSLGRKVAVKTLRADMKSDAATLRLLREAWITGSLEHPNIVPIYDLGLDEDGSPIIVLKRIEGSPWTSVMRDEDGARSRFGATDLIEYNLRILIQLCNAVALAHSRGVLHRDLKPENVMIGSFGEVYLVDWGIAVSLNEDRTGRLPLASKEKQMAGTPCYMAPEMLGAMGELSTRTDVYLLGAILHEILTGAPPHQGDHFRALVASILLSRFEYGPEVPRELAAIAHKAMSREASDRFASADDFRARLEWYLRHRSSLALSSEADKRLAEIRALLASGEGDLRDRVHRLAAEARFGFRQALASSEDNERARDGLRELIGEVVGFELERGTATAASAALAELADPPDALVRRVREALARERARLERLERLDAEHDASIGRRTRVAVSGMLGLLWTVLPQVGHQIERRWPDAPMEGMYLWTVSLILAGGALAVWARESMWKTAVNRRVMAAGLLAFAAQLALEVGAVARGISVAVTFAMHLFLYFVVMAALAIFVDRRLWVSSIAFLASFFVVSLVDGIHWHVMSAANFVLLLNFAFAWGSRTDRLEGRAWREARRRAERSRGEAS
jgi:eukaryotic-like serine/threonine-protein kinase